MVVMSWQVSRRQHIRHAAVIWLLVGTLLGVQGMVWVLGDQHTSRLLAVILPCALLVGLLKGVAVLSRSAARTVTRIRALADLTPVWQLYSPSTYLLVGGMMVMGRAFRWAGPHWHIVGDIGALYLVVGIALISGSWAYWQAP